MPLAPAAISEKKEPDLYQADDHFIHSQGDHVPDIVIGDNGKQIECILDHRRDTQNIAMYGKKAVSSLSHGIHRWYVKIKSLPSIPKKTHKMNFGLVFRNDNDNDNGKIIYAMQFNHDHDKPSPEDETLFIESYELSKDDVICVELDLKERRISYFVNKTKPGQSHDVIPIKKGYIYQLCIQLHSQGEAVSIEKYVETKVMRVKTQWNLEAMNRVQYGYDHSKCKIVRDGRGIHGATPSVFSSYIIQTHVPCVYRWYMAVTGLPFHRSKRNTIKVGICNGNSYIYFGLREFDLENHDVICVELDVQKKRLSMNVIDEDINEQYPDDIDVGINVFYCLAVVIHRSGLALDISDVFVHQK